jgi:hypothetical protein
VKLTIHKQLILKTDKERKFKIIEGGIEEFEATNEYKLKVAEIKRDLTDQYSRILSNERNWVRRLLIKIKCEIAIRKKIRALSSLKNLHAASYL